MDTEITWLSIIVDKATKRWKIRRNLAASVNMANYGKELFLNTNVYKFTLLSIDHANSRQHAVLSKRKLKTVSQDALVRHTYKRKESTQCSVHESLNLYSSRQMRDVRKKLEYWRKKTLCKGKKILKWFIAIPQLSIWPSARRAI